MLGPTTNPFQPKDATPNETPARIAKDIAALRSRATVPKDVRIEEILGDEFLVILSEPEYFIAFIQYMKPNEMNSITKAS